MGLAVGSAALPAVERTTLSEAGLEAREASPPTPSPHKAKETYSVHFARQSGTLTTM